VDALGLEVKWATNVWDPQIGNVATEVIEPIRPFWIRVAMEGTNANNLCSRAGTESDWHTNKDCAKVPTTPSFDEKHGRLAFGRGLSRRLTEETTLQVTAEESLRRMLGEELYQIRRELKNDELQNRLRSMNLRVRLPATDPHAAPDDTWAAFVNSFRLEELLQIVDRLEESLPDLHVASERCTPKELAYAIERVDPQMALEVVLNGNWIRPSDHDDKPLPGFRIRRDSAGAYFKPGNTDWTGKDASRDSSWYWEATDNGSGIEPPAASSSRSTDTSRSRREGSHT
jgi:hypothetical protein